MKKEQENQLKEIGVDLATFLQVAAISEEERASWEALVPEMNIEQLQKLHVYLYTKIPSEVKETINMAVKGAQKITQDHEQVAEEIEQKTSAKLDLLESQLNEE